MKKVFLAIVLALIATNVAIAYPVQLVSSYAYDQNKDKDRKKDPPGPPIVRDKEKNRGGDRGKEPPPKKKPN